MDTRRHRYKTRQPLATWPNGGPAVRHFGEGPGPRVNPACRPPARDEKGRPRARVQHVTMGCGPRPPWRRMAAAGDKRAPHGDRVPERRDASEWRHKQSVPRCHDARVLAPSGAECLRRYAEIDSASRSEAPRATPPPRGGRVGATPHRFHQPQRRGRVVGERPTAPPPPLVEAQSSAKLANSRPIFGRFLANEWPISGRWQAK